MKQLLITTTLAVVLVGCGPSISLDEAAWRGNIKVLKQRIAADIDFNLKNERGSTPLYLEVNLGHNEISKLLIAKDPDVNVITGGKSQSQTLLDFAKSPLRMDQKKGQKEIADLLHEHGGKTEKELEAKRK